MEGKSASSAESMNASAELVVPRSMPMFIDLFDLDFRGGQHGPGRGGRQIDLVGFPSFVAKQAAGRFSAGRDIAHQLHCSFADTGGLGERTLNAVDDGLQAEVALEGLPRVRLHVAYGRAHLI